MELVKKILRISFWVLLIAGLTTLFAFVQEKENDQVCKRVNIHISNNLSKENYFVKEGAIRSLIARRFGQIENTSLKNIDVNSLERLIYSNPWVARADVYASIDGVVNIDIEQRTALLRVINKKNESYYIDTNGRLMPWSTDFTPKVLIANGNINESFKDWNTIRMSELINNDTLKTNTLLDDLYSIAKFILADEFWSAHVEQIFVNTNGELELVPRIGRHKIIFGSSDNLKEKFWKLKTFYKDGLNYTGWEDYDTLNLKYHNQVVCTKANYRQRKINR